MKKTLLLLLLSCSSAFFLSAQVTIPAPKSSDTTATTGSVAVIDTVGSQDSGIGSALSPFFTMAFGVIDSLVPILIGLALIGFFVFLVQFIYKGNESGDARSKSMKGMGWSLILLTIMVSVWGILAFFNKTLGIQPGGDMPKVKIPGQI